MFQANRGIDYFFGAIPRIEPILQSKGSYDVAIALAGCTPAFPGAGTGYEMAVSTAFGMRQSRHVYIFQLEEVLLIEAKQVSTKRIH